MGNYESYLPAGFILTLVLMLLFSPSPQLVYSAQNKAPESKGNRQRLREELESLEQLLDELKQIRSDLQILKESFQLLERKITELNQRIQNLNEQLEAVKSKFSKLPEGK